jgi:hypothetical protein
LRLLESGEAEEKVRRNALPEAARIGIAATEAGRPRNFESRAALSFKLTGGDRDKRGDPNRGSGRSA